jgi:hypothetical protein
MEIELSQFEAQCASLKLRGVKVQVIQEILQIDRDYELDVGIIEGAIKRAGDKLQRKIDQESS